MRAKKVMTVWPQHVADAYFSNACLSREGEAWKMADAWTSESMQAWGQGPGKTEPGRLSSSSSWFLLCSWTKEERNMKGYDFGSWVLHCICPLSKLESNHKVQSQTWSSFADSGGETRWKNTEQGLYSIMSTTSSLQAHGPQCIRHSSSCLRP